MHKNNYSLNNSGKGSQTINSIQLNHNLMKKLQVAIDTQCGIVKKLENDVNQKIQILKKDQAQTKALESLIQRYRQQEMRAKNRNEQKELDSQILAKLRSG